MSIDTELLRLALEREQKAEFALTEMLLEGPHLVRRRLRAYLFRQVDFRRIARPDEGIPQLRAVSGVLEELACSGVEFASGARLEFAIQFEKQPRGWLVTRVRFGVRLPPARTINMIRIHLNLDASRDPLAVPRCHMHIDRSQAHIPFPIMDPLLILHLICEGFEPHIGV